MAELFFLMLAAGSGVLAGHFLGRRHWRRRADQLADVLSQEIQAHTKTRQRLVLATARVRNARRQAVLGIIKSEQG